MKRIIVLSVVLLMATWTVQAQVWKIVRTDGRVEKIPASKVELVTVEEVTEHEYVDLGLPSGTLWATTNVGAENPEDFGNFFAWGEVTGVDEGKTNYTWKTYKWCNGSFNQLTKYCVQDSLGAVDNRYSLLSEDDAAYVCWGPQWRIPNYHELMELTTECTWEQAEMNGVPGCEVTGPNGNTLFLPAGGWYEQKSHNGVDVGGDYWGRSLRGTTNERAWGMWFFNDRHGYAITFPRYFGRMIRPVYVP